MRVFLAGGSGVLGQALIPLLVAEGHQVVATTRSEAKTGALHRLGATPVLLDVFERDDVRAAVARFEPDVVLHQLTDLSGGDSASNARLRRIGTRHLVEAAQQIGVRRVVAQSISWIYRPGTTPAVEDDPQDSGAPEPRRTTVAAVANLESIVLGCAEGVVLRYGQLYGPRTWYAREGRFGQAARAGLLPVTDAVTSFVHVEDAARAAVQALHWPSGVVNVVDDEPAAGCQWVPVFAAAVGAPPPKFPAKSPHTTASDDIGRPVSNATLRETGFTFVHPSWREGFTTL
ncbi:NAD(P)-dependent oxidoreductase [Kineococcus sp. NUM-3379]